MTHPKYGQVTRQTFLISIFGLILSSSVPARADAPVPLDLTAKLVEIPSKLPPDDLYDYAYVMRYQVQGGPWTNSSSWSLTTSHSSRDPKIKDKMKAQVGGKLRSFKTGDVHKLKLSPYLKSVWKGALVDEYAATDRKSVRYWCLQADPV